MNISKKFIRRYQFFCLILGVFVLSFFHFVYPKILEKKTLQEKNVSYFGVIEKKHKNLLKNAGVRKKLMYVITSEKTQKKMINGYTKEDNGYDLYDFIETGDSIIKVGGEFRIQVIRDGKTYDFVDEYLQNEYVQKQSH